MDKPNKIKGSSIRLGGYGWLVAVLWTVAVFASLLWTLTNQRWETQEVAKAQARAAHEKDVIYRRWNAGHGGVYAPVTEKTPPNPYLDAPEREITTPSGRRLTLINPAYMTRQAHELAAEQSGTRGHLTSLNPIRPENTADPWETSSLEAFEEGEVEVSSIEQLDGVEYMRLMRPLITEKGCLRCHAVQGYKLGDIRGGISVSVPMAPLWAIAHKQVLVATLGHGLLWLLGLTGIGESTRRLNVRVRERQRAEAELHQAHRATNELLESIPSVLITVDSSDRVTAWNNIAECLFGIEADDVFNRALRDVPITWDRAAVARAISECRSHNQSVRVNEIRFKRQDGTDGFLGIALSPLNAGVRERGGVLLVATDITEHKILLGQLVQAQKLESIGQLAAGIAHEINTPIQYVGDNVRFLSDSVDDLFGLIGSYRDLTSEIAKGADAEDCASKAATLEQEADLTYIEEEVPKSIAQSLDGVGRVSKIVRAMKDFSHPGGDEKQMADLNKAIESTITVAQNEWKHVAEMVTELDPALASVPCLVGDFNQVILNIVINAAHAIADVVGKDAGEKGTITVATRQDDGWAEIRISDTGTGIPEETRSKVFDHFFTTKEVGKGTGQGLAIAHAVITEKHSGSITLESEVGKGTTFIIRLPIEPESDTAEETRQHEEAHSLR